MQITDESLLMLCSCSMYIEYKFEQLIKMKPIYYCIPVLSTTFILYGLIFLLQYSFFFHRRNC